MIQHSVKVGAQSPDRRRTNRGALLFSRNSSKLAAMYCVAGPVAALTDAGCALAAGSGRAFFVRRAPMRWPSRLSGVVLIGGGIWLTLTRR